MEKITLTNSFHHTSCVVLVPAGTTPDEAWTSILYDATHTWEPTRAAKAKYDRVRRTLCGIKGCCCGAYRP